MKLLNVIASLDPAHGGVTEGALKLADSWNEGGHAVEFVTLDQADAQFLAAIDHPVTALGALPAASGEQRRPPLWKRFGYSPRLVPWLKQHRADYDAVLVHGLWNYATMAARRALPNGKVPYFVFPHGSLDPWFRHTYPLKDLAKRLLWPLNEGVLVNDAAAVLFTTQEELNLADRTFRPWHAKAQVVGFGTSDVPGEAQVQIAAFRAAVPALAGRPYLLFLSRVHPKKGCDLLIDAFARLGPDTAGIDLVMAGPADPAWAGELKQQADARGVSARVHWTGMIEGDVKWGAFRGCEAFVLPSHSENFGIVVAEALACARPVLITDKVNLWREVAEDYAGLVEPDTPEGIHRLLARFFALSPERRADMAANARTCFERRFRMEAAAGNILDIIRGHRSAEPAAS